MFDTADWANELIEAKFDTVAEFEKNLMKWESILQNALEKHCYNTFGSYAEFYLSFKRFKQDIQTFLLDFKPQLMQESMSCVGLSLSLLNDISQADGKHGHLFSLVSCEEMFPVDYENKKDFSIETEETVKEHVLVCLRVCIEQRSGYILFDPGYHISRPIIVMHDGLYPHTGWFVASNNEGKPSKEYNYRAINDSLIGWKVRENKYDQLGNCKTKEYVNLIYVKKHFTKYANITEKRSLIFNLKSFVIRDRKGIVAGFYCVVEPKNLTIFYHENDRKITHKFSIEDIDKEHVRQQLTNVVKCMNIEPDEWEKQVEQFIWLLSVYRDSIHDQEFISDLCKVNKAIEG